MKPSRTISEKYGKLEPVIYVYVTCGKCQETFDEKEITDPDVDIEEDLLGRDVLSFKCPKCGKRTKSLRRG